MRKIQKICGLQPTLPFNEYDIFNAYRESFQSSELGGVYRMFPFRALAKEFGLKERVRGRSSFFTPQGKIALMVLKSYTDLSDRDLIAQLNANIHYQLFCGVHINPASPLNNFKIVSEIRCELGRKLHIDRLQAVLASYWKPYLRDTHVLMTDATRNGIDVMRPVCVIPQT